ncbi:pentapeptide repeat-containing protein [Legionella pneumophila]|uniref:Secreted effector protein PipB2 n=1 Tax=Legionella pneumophila subsp. pascullei TaxID=91890 RepID=A0AAX2IZU8_LEGPN|nr:pentapeptide repeat-containing protein [Legionella pneumophila]AMP93497.1 hypothetical protein AXF36_13135 [Legionella pneumophila subsp. pascullei]SQG91446.1 secreted effector protein PipB2 [Legionella pneumophila subsp. pascullei]VEH07992.1 secreted effector protein PipB2 [Legionella pneumophila subsp. pascullei]HAU3861623.1 pentapeptide repeat-containing protein [Legionella pneumophila]HBD7059913.1 pentapeptide repeat-containing protein [Legionella pneumophila]
MKKIVLTASLFGIICPSFHAYAYVPSDVSSFENETDCIRCNLTQSSFSSNWSMKEKSGKFDGTLFTRFSLSGYKLIDSSFVDTNFVQSNLSNDQFDNGIFRNSNLSYSHLSTVNFIKSTFNNVNFSHISMSGHWSSCSFNQVDFNYARLEGVSFLRANLVDVNFANANLKHADFSRVHVERVNFDNADLSYAILIGSNITKEHLSNTKTYKCATLSNGEVYTNDGEFTCN